MYSDELNVMIGLATEAYKCGDLSHAESLANEVMSIVNGHRVDSEGGMHQRETDEVALLRCRSRARGILGDISWSKGEYPQALEYFSASLDDSTATDDRVGIAQAFNSFGLTHWKQSNLATALEYFQRALAINEELGNKRGMASNLHNTGIIYAVLSDNASALVQYQKALAINEETDNKEWISNNLGGIGVVYANLGDYTQALEYHRQALAISEELNLKPTIAGHLVNIGLAIGSLGKYETTIEYLHRALYINEELNRKSGVLNCCGNLGEAYKQMLDLENSLVYSQKALSIAEEIGNRVGVAFNLGNIGELYANANFEKYDSVKAAEYLLKSISIAESIGVKIHAYGGHKVLADMYRREKQWEQSDTHFRMFYELLKEAQSEDAVKQAQLMEQKKVIAQREKEIAIAKASADAQMNATTDLLHKVLPSSIATRLINGEKVADYFPEVSILFADIVGFTPIAAKMQALDVLSMLNYVFGECDRIMEFHGCQKIKTIGDGYMAVCGAPIPCDDHAERLADAALDLLHDIELPESLRSTLPKGSAFHLRIGLHCGPAFAGIVGEKGFVYDVYSDAVNLASRMESHGEPGKIHCSEDYVKHVEARDASLSFAPRGAIEVKGKGSMQTYFLTHRSQNSSTVLNMSASQR